MTDRPNKSAPTVNEAVAAEPKAPKHDDASSAEVQAKTDEAEAKGHFGYSPDPTPNENYTVAGVLAGKPTPETDADLAAEARTSIEDR